MNFNPLISSPDNLHIGRETTQLLDRMQLLHPKSFAITDQSTGVLRMEHILGTDGHVASPLLNGFTQRPVAFGKGRTIFYIFHRLPVI